MLFIPERHKVNNSIQWALYTIHGIAQIAEDIGCVHVSCRKGAVAGRGRIGRFNIKYVCYTFNLKTAWFSPQY